jgi:hypothetical protein
MLLELARDTITRAEGAPTQPIPVVFNLSSWAEKRQSIAEWLVNELNFKYNIPRRVARPWVENEDLLLLLDGLDEVKLEHRQACVKAINDFRQEHGLTPLVVCSRIADYEALTAQLKLQGAVLLQPLTPQQVDQYLEGAGTELLAVRRTLQHDPTFQELAQTPLMLSIMTLAYRGMSVQDLQSLDTTEARRRHVLGAYVQRMFERRGGDQRYSPEQTIRWLAWLAEKMSQHTQTVFLIERMQPSWLHTSAQRRLYVIIASLIIGLILGLVGMISGLMWGLMYNNPFYGLLGGLLGGLLAGSMFGLLVEQMPGLLGRLPDGQFVVPTDIKPVEVLELSWKQVGTALILGLLNGLIAARLFGTIAGLLFGLITWLFGGLLLMLNYIETETRVVPNQGIRQSATNAVIIGLLSGLLVWLIGRPILGPVFGLVGLTGVLWGLMFGLLFGGLAVIRHFTLRFILYRSGHIPWYLTRFLDYAAERIFLRKVGGGYIFIHRLLQDYFASLYQE